MKKKKEKNIILRLTDEQHAKIKRYAKTQGISMSRLIRRRILAEVNENVNTKK